MDRAKYCKAIIGRHKKLMECIDRESPPLTLKGRLVSQESDISSPRSIFTVSTTSRSVKLTDLVEQRVFIEDQSDTSGTVLDAYDDKLVIALHRRLPPSTYVLKVFANHNNEALLKAAISFAESAKEVHAALLQPQARRTARSRPSSDDASDASPSGESEATAPAPGGKIKSTAAAEGQGTGRPRPNPPSCIAEECGHELSLFNPSLNQSQRRAVYLALQGAPFKILGPPGTGKTEVIVEIIVQSLSAKKSVLVCGPSNISVDNIITRFTGTQYCTDNDVKFYRLGSAWKGLFHLNLEHRAGQAVSFLDEEAGSMRAGRGGACKSAGRELRLLRENRAQRKREFIKNLKSETSLVFATLFSSLKEAFYFDLCIVDEACQATELECFMGIAKARTFILVGDPNQLCPDSPSLYERAALPTVVLNQQYRMPGEIIRFSNEYFYGGGISSSRQDDFLFFGESRILLVDTSYFSYAEAPDGPSKVNEAEARLAAEAAAWLWRQHMAADGLSRLSIKGDASKVAKAAPKHRQGMLPAQTPSCTIGIIAPYSAQVLFIRDLLGAQGGCSVDTVDGFQGQERDFIILSLVRSNAEGEYGFLSDAKRMNVALTRCRRGLVVIGDSQNFQRSHFFRDLFRFLNKSAYVVDPELFRQLISG